MLTLQYIPYTDIENLNSDNRIKLILDFVKKENIVLLQGRLKKGEETKLIEKTMKSINKKFKGIELGVIYPEKKKENLFKSMKSKFINFVLGDRHGITIVGPATLVKEINKDPNKIQLLLNKRKKK
ncbi:DUF2073 domain-containing protein [Nanoarchaeota archaeon]